MSDSRKKNVTAPDGTIYDSISDMCRAYGTTYKDYYSKTSRGWTKEQTLGIEPRKGRSVHITRIQGPDGKIYPSIKALCRAYGAQYTRVLNRLNHGWNVEEALTIEKRKNRKKYVRPDGQEFDSKEEMYRSLGLTRNSYYERLKRGWSKEEALSVPNLADTDHKRRASVEAPNGKRYVSKKEMCEDYGIRYSTYKFRRDSRWDEEEALTNPKMKRHTAPKAPDGKEYASESAMCRAYGIDYALYKSRRNKGWTVEEALTLPKTCRRKLITAPNGKKYASEKAMCRAYGVSYYSYKARKYAGWDTKDALETPVRSCRHGVRLTSTNEKEAQK